jgi:hypothetical protein
MPPFRAVRCNRDHYRFRLLELDIVLFVVRRGRVIEDHYLHGMAVAPKACRGASFRMRLC